MVAAPRSAALGGRPDHHHGRPRERSDYALDRSFARGGAAARAGKARTPGVVGRAVDVRRSRRHGGGVLRRAAARGGPLVPARAVDMSAELVRRARAVMKNAYAPYSKFH